MSNLWSLSCTNVLGHVHRYTIWSMDFTCKRYIDRVLFEGKVSMEPDLTRQTKAYLEKAENIRKWPKGVQWQECPVENQAKTVLYFHQNIMAKCRWPRTIRAELSSPGCSLEDIKSSQQCLLSEQRLSYSSTFNVLFLHIGWWPESQEGTQTSQSVLVHFLVVQFP